MWKEETETEGSQVHSAQVREVYFESNLNLAEE